LRLEFPDEMTCLPSPYGDWRVGVMETGTGFEACAVSESAEDTKGAVVATGFESTG